MNNGLAAAFGLAAIAIGIAFGVVAARDNPDTTIVTSPEPLLPKGGPATSGETSAGSTSVKAPLTSVETDESGTRVKAPGVDITVPKSETE